MSPFNRLPGSRTAPSGMEWKVLKRIPSILLAGTVIAAGFVLLAHFGWVDLEAKALARAQYAAFGAWLSFVMMALTLAFFCAIIVVMKGPAYVWDAYPLPKEEEQPPHSPTRD